MATRILLLISIIFNVTGALLVHRSNQDVKILSRYLEIKSERLQTTRNALLSCMDPEPFLLQERRLENGEEPSLW